MRQRETFQQILEKTAPAASRRVVERARLASSIAKCARNATSRREAYAVKRRALEHGVATFAGDFALSSVENDGALVGLRFRHELCLHLPVAACSPGTVRWVEGERRRVVREWGMVREAA